VKPLVFRWEEHVVDNIRKGFATFQQVLQIAFGVSSQDWVGIGQIVVAFALVVATIGLVKATNNLGRIEILPNFIKNSEGIQGTEFYVSFSNKGKGTAKNIVSKARGKDGTRREIEQRSTKVLDIPIALDVPINGEIYFVVHDVAADDRVSITLDYSDMRGRKCRGETFAFDIASTPRSVMPETSHSK
jgi:hypothetical protein